MADNNGKAMVVAPQGGSLALWNEEQVTLLKGLVAKGASNTELAMLGELSQRYGLDPFQKQIYCIVRGEGDRRSVTYQTGIDGYRLIAERSHEYDGQDGPFWCGEDGEWRDVWPRKEPPAAAKVVVRKKGTDRTYTGIAHYSEYVQKKILWGQDANGRRIRKGEEPNEMWGKMPASQLAKCAEALALRKAFPNDLSGLYTSEEMAQADNAYIDVTPAPAGPPAATTLGGEPVDAVTGEYIEPPAPQGQRGNSGGTRAAARAAAQQKAGEADKPVIKGADKPLRERMDYPPSENAPVAWMEDLAEQLKAWFADDVLAPLGIAEWKHALVPIVGENVGRGDLIRWAAGLPEGADPFRAACDAVMANVKEASAAKDATPAAPSSVFDNDDLPFE